jgi:hypothetical protein
MYSLPFFREKMGYQFSEFKKTSETILLEIVDKAKIYKECLFNTKGWMFKTKGKTVGFYRTGNLMDDLSSENDDPENLSYFIEAADDKKAKKIPQAHFLKAEGAVVPVGFTGKMSMKEYPCQDGGKIIARNGWLEQPLIWKTGIS